MSAQRVAVTDELFAMAMDVITDSIVDGKPVNARKARALGIDIGILDKTLQTEWRVLQYANTFEPIEYYQKEVLPHDFSGKQWPELIKRAELGGVRCMRFVTWVQRRHNLPKQVPAVHIGLPLNGLQFEQPISVEVFLTDSREWIVYHGPLTPKGKHGLRRLLTTDELIDHLYSLESAKQRWLEPESPALSIASMLQSFAEKERLRLQDEMDNHVLESKIGRLIPRQSLGLLDL